MVTLLDSLMSFDEAGNRISESILATENKVIPISSNKEVGRVTISSFYTATPEKLKRLVSYEIKFMPIDKENGLSDYDYNRAKLTLLRKIIIEAFGIYLQTLEHLVKS